MAFDNLLNNCIKLRLLGFVKHIGLVFPHHRLVGRNGNDVQRINFLKFDAFGHCRTRHTRQLVIQTEVILEGDGRKRFGFALHLYALFGFNRLMQTLAVTSAEHNASREFVYD